MRGMRIIYIQDNSQPNLTGALLAVLQVSLIRVVAGLIVLKRTLRIGAPVRAETISTNWFIFSGSWAVRAITTSLAQLR